MTVYVLYNILHNADRSKIYTIHSSIQVGGVCTYVIIMTFPNFGRCIMPFRFEEELVFLFFFDGGVEVDV
jgi:hypothetical protein